ncbi:zinc ABC transporter permease AztB [Nocardia goodfellowii]|uniref:ABC-type Mn2+/Zn2+ transport system permease subunit n=1 Tax=Nocardia goodfellowii TaxID=882446 RepID=A0ABS4QD46_9NOCA|nr:zinc ABC transporter permease AztB [Nocardia goodfellowii]MBP2189617.1 ABC-type Mn2+/Zn2+ transport system permease subunit [Nocardia goodfellowii]
MEWLVDPFEVAFVQRALWGGLLVSCICALAGTWVVVRGMAFLGDAMAHGMLPGVAVAALLGGNLLLGAAISCGAMAFGVSVLTRNRRFSADTGIGLLFVGMLALGVIIVSRSDSFAVDLTAFLFGDVLGVRASDLGFLVVALVLAIAVAALGHRAFVALAFDPRKAHTLGLRPKAAQVALVGLVTLAIVASFHVVGTLLVFGLLIAPPAAATFWADRIPWIMGLAALFGGVSTFAGLLISWHAQTAAGATIAIVAVGLFFLSAIVSALRDRLRRSGTGAAVLAAVVAVPLVGCGTGEAPSEPVATETPHGYVEGAEETADAQSRLILADQGTGAIRVLDLITEKVTEAGKAEGAQRLVGDGRYGYAGVGDSVRITDGGAWTVDHDDHVHYYRAPVREAGSIAGGRITAVHSDKSVVAVAFDHGATVLLDRSELDKGTVKELRRIDDGLAVPYAESLVVAGQAGRVDVRSREGGPVTTLAEPCAAPRGQTVTRRGVVFGCADGALVVRKQEDGFTGEKIPYPQPVPEADRATEFTHRPGSTTLTAAAGQRGLWSLDIRKKTWRLVPLADVIAVNTAGEGAPLLALTRDGVLHGFDPETGAPTTRTKVLAQPADTAALVVDTARAYVNDASARVVHEIDYNDNLRVARTFNLDIAPTLMVETGQ